MNDTSSSIARPAGQPPPQSHYTVFRLAHHNVRWALLAVAALLVITSCFMAGFAAGGSAARRQLAMRIATNDYYLPVDSRQLTAAIVPLIPGPLARKALGEADKPSSLTAEELLSDAGLAELVADLGELFPLGWRVADPLTVPDEFFIATRRQHRADQVLDWMVKQAAPSDFRSLGVLSCDIYIPGYNFLFGLAKTGGNACLASSSRMGGRLEGAQLSPVQRWHSIARHELGHSLGLAHNETQRSVMVYGNSLAELDGQATELTNSEWQRLEQIHPILWRR